MLPTPFRAQVIALSTLSSSTGSQELSLLCPVRALRVYIEHSALYRTSERHFVGFCNRAKGGPVMKQGISKWLVDAITLAYSSLGLQCPIGVRAHSTRGIASSSAWSSGVSISKICEAAGWASPSTFVRFYNLDVPDLQARVLSAYCSLDLHCSSPTFTCSVHTIWTPGINLRVNTQAMDDPMTQPVLGVFYWLPWVLLPHESWFWVVPRHSMAWLYSKCLRHSTSEISKGNVLCYYRNLGYKGKFA